MHTIDSAPLPASYLRHSLYVLIACALSLLPVAVTAQVPAAAQVRIERLLDAPIIHSGTDASLGDNIQGPSVIRVPDWLENPLGRYYLYFADHKGRYIRLAYADAVTGPWKIHGPGSLKIEDSFFLTEAPVVSAAELADAVASREAAGARLMHDIATELTTPHIASPDVHVDHENRRIVMYFHGLAGLGQQFSRVATSSNGIDFIAQQQNLGRTYLRAFAHQDMTYLMAMPGQFYRSRDGFTEFESGPVLFGPTMRHSALLKRDDSLYVFWTRVGDVPESIMLSTIDISGDWQQWQESEETVVLRPERPWEGANSPMEPSVRSSAYGLLNQLRDPAILVDGDTVYLFYAYGGESGIALARVLFD